jgi:YegS/Rv2252/BmrU family lipid kinase
MGHPDIHLDHGAATARKRALEAAIRSERRAVLVVNTQSRRGRHLFDEARQRLVDADMILDGAYAVRDPARLPEIVRESIAAGHKLVLVGGGDGTISSVVDEFAYRDSVLGVLPVGTANSFARAVGLPLDLAGAIDVAICGKVADVDLGVVNDNYFANAAAIGLPASIARDMPRTVKKVLGRIGYLFVAVARLVRHQPFRCTVTSDGHAQAFDAMEVRIANGEYQGGIRVTDEAGVETRDLVVQSITGRSRLSIARFWSRAVMGGGEGSNEDVHVIRGPELLIETDPPQYVSIDGEPVTRTPIRARVAHQALLLMVPGDHADIH